MADGAHAGPLTAARVGELLRRVHHALARHREEIDDLNVFPVPDGDTGSNLVMTVRSAVEAMAEAAGPESVEAMMRGALTGARGNSGVIFSQVLRALGECVRDGAADAPAARIARYRWALERARELAYEAVGDPLEGTMLTAIRVAAEAAAVAQADNLEELSAHVVGAVSEAVQRTRVQLDANREAGVVDAGARGIEVFLQAVHDHLTGAPERTDAPPPLVSRDRNRRVEREAGSLEYRYEVQYLLAVDESRSNEHVQALRRRLGELGDSVIVIAAGDLMNVHVHTNRIGEVIEAGVAFGEPSRIEVTEFEDLVSDRELLAEIAPRRPDQQRPRRPLAPVVVLDGHGLTELAEELEATVVPGASGRLPTVADLLNAIAHTNGERIAILPAHPNAVPTAHQASAVSVAEGGRELIVIEEADAPVSALAALAVCDPTIELDRAVAAMRQAAAACRCGEVVTAVRDAEVDGRAVSRDQPLAVVGGRVRGAHEDPVDALVDVLRALEPESAEVVTLVAGAEVDDAERARAEAAVRAVLGDGPELDLIDGGQRPQRYLLGVE